MPRRILVDTNIIIDFLRKRDKKHTIFYELFSQEENKPVICFITISELWAGKSMEEKQTRKFVEELIKGCEILEPNIEIAKLSGEILRKTNYSISLQDAQISAYSLYYNLPILTLNKKDFLKIPKIKLFQF